MAWPLHRASRQWLFLATGLCALGTGLIWLYTHNVSVRREEDTLSSNDGETSAVYAPILGTQDEPLRLYFAPKDAARSTIAAYNRMTGSRPRTPLFIGFTQNNALLIQAALSYIAAGWPPEDIVVIDNSGTLDANSRSDLTKKNQFFLDYFRLQRLGLSVLQTPTLLTFAQLQNFYLRISVTHNWSFFFWTHMDVVVLGDEGVTPYRSFYQRVLDVVHEFQGRNDWAVKWFSYDALTMVNVDAWRKIGQWDPFIPYYHSDCDAYSRMALHGYDRESATAYAGTIFDVATTLDDYERKLFPAKGEAGPNSSRYQALREALQELEKAKNEDPGGRNTWQDSQGINAPSEPWTYNPKGFKVGCFKISEIGKHIYYNKWASEECSLEAHEKTLSDMWKYVHL